MCALIRAVDVGCQLGCVHSRLSILKSVNFEVQSGECVAIMGASGIGKTTLLKAVAGQVSLSHGEIRIDEAPLSESTGKVVYQSQSGGVFPWLTIEEHLKLSYSWNQSLAEDMADSLNMNMLRKTHAAHLSGGERKRLSLILALLAATDIALLDEPFAGLDIDLRRRAMNTIENVRRQRGLTILLVSHAAEECAELCTRVLFLKGRPANVVSEIVLNQTTDGRSGQAVAELGERLNSVLMD